MAPEPLVRAALSHLPPASTVRAVVAAGKAARGMFAALDPDRLPGCAVIATHPVDPFHAGAAIEWFDAGHPAPNAGSVAAAGRALDLAGASDGDGELLVLLSGGASAMLAAPARGIGLAEKIETSKRLMHAGAAIHELNCVRKHLSRIKGGRLAAACGGRVVTLALSDVHGPVADDPSVIGSGPTVADDSTFADALAIVRRYGVELPPAVRGYLERGAAGDEAETVKTGDPRLARAVYSVIGSRQTAVAGAAAAAEADGYTVVTIDPATTGEARVAAAAFVETALRSCREASRPMCVIGSGETTVTVRGDGLGGRNQEFAVAGGAALARDGRAAAHAALGSAGTDGIDGPTDAAGAVIDAGLLARAAAAGLDWQQALDRNDAYHFAAGLDALLRWGPTGTNVGDLHVLVLAPPLQSSL